MPKVLGIDFGKVRTGLAITDELQIIASPLQTVPSKLVLDEIEKIIRKEKVETIVLGEARRLDGSESEITIEQQKFANKLAKRFPSIRVVRVDESYTSKMASQSMLMSGMKKSDRQKKENLDMISAALILRSFLDSRPK